MADGVTIQVNGLAEVERLLNTVAADLRGGVIRKALIEGGKIMVADAKRRAPVLKKASRTRRPGVMRAAIKVRSSKFDKGQAGVVGVYIRVSATKAQRRRAPVSGDPYFYQWVEGGHLIVPRGMGTRGMSRGEIRRLTKLGLRQTITARRATAAARRKSVATGFVRPYKFLEPAFNATKQAVVDKFKDAIARRVAQANAVVSGNG